MSIHTCEMHDQSSLSIYKRGVVDRCVWREEEGNLCFIFSNSSSNCLFGILCNVELTRGISWVLPISSPKATSFTLQQSHLGNLDQKDRQLEQLEPKLIMPCARFLGYSFHDTKVQKQMFVSNFGTKSGKGEMF